MQFRLNIVQVFSIKNHELNNLSFYWWGKDFIHFRVISFEMQKIAFEAEKPNMETIGDMNATSGSAHHVHTTTGDESEHYEMKEMTCGK